ncbi:mechanosensitive ion channel [Halorarum halophilum]|uniref:Mechanosensitive ion channel n=1 Tax=Halorarum halophilum TaxID=2743090 RepID=A0A7D5GDT5_9EURY|nr:mechanosensitive ion channel domain-containing protein [Halobaculum halophilum]QLG29185.1 mechanosensitive ion channel [Halobaculum halophilum]
MAPLQVDPTDPVPPPIDATGDALVGALTSAGWFLLAAGVVYVVGQVLVVPVAVRAVRSRNRNNPTVVDATGTYLRILLLVVAALVGVVAAGYGGILSNSAVVVAAATLVLGIAGQELIGSLVSGLFLVTDPEFNVGDWVSWPDGEGRIERVGFRVTRVRTAANEIITVPNTALTTDSIVRPYGHGRVRASEEVFVAYDDDIAAARRTLADVAASVDGVLSSPAPETRVAELGDDAVTVAVDYWIEDPTAKGVVTARSAVRARAVSRLEAEGVTLAPPAGRELDGRLTVDREE